MPDTLSSGGAAAFHIDHYKPKKHFPELETVYGNLFYCCATCNVFKGAYWPRPEVEKTRFVPNPCDHRMFEHLRFRGAAVEAHSEPGQWTLALLELNDARAVRFRQDSLTALELATLQIERLRQLRNKLERKIASSQQGEAELRDKLNQLDEKLAATVSMRARQLGEDP